MLTVWMIRWFTIDIVNHLAKVKGGARAASLDMDIARRLGVGNSTGWEWPFPYPSSCPYQQLDVCTGRGLGPHTPPKMTWATRHAAGYGPRLRLPRKMQKHGVQTILCRPRSWLIYAQIWNGLKHIYTPGPKVRSLGMPFGNGPNTR